MNNPVAAVLREARELIAKPGGWTKYTNARDAAGKPVWPHSPEACSFCLLGAVVATSGRKCESCLDALARAGIAAPISYNDAPFRTQAEIVAVLDRAIEIAQQEAPNA